MLGGSMMLQAPDRDLLAHSFGTSTQIFLGGGFLGLAKVRGIDFPRSLLGVFSIIRLIVRLSSILRLDVRLFSVWAEDRLIAGL